MLFPELVEFYKQNDERCWWNFGSFKHNENWVPIPLYQIVSIQFLNCSMIIPSIVEWLLNAVFEPPFNLNLIRDWQSAYTIQWERERERERERELLNIKYYSVFQLTDQWTFDAKNYSSWLSCNTFSGSWLYSLICRMYQYFFSSVIWIFSSFHSSFFTELIIRPRLFSALWKIDFLINQPIFLLFL